MDLFRFAYELYPFIPASLLQSALTIAKYARIVDMRSSPYDVSAYEECGPPIPIETFEGRKLFIQEQENLLNLSVPIRKELLESYKTFLTRMLV